MLHINPLTWQDTILLLITFGMVLIIYRNGRQDKAKERERAQLRKEAAEKKLAEALPKPFDIEEALSEEIEVVGVDHNVISFAHLSEHLQEVIEHIAFKNSYKIETTIVTMKAKACVAIVPIGEYERMKELYEEREMKEIAAIIQERCGEGKVAKHIPLEELIEINASRKKQEKNI